MNNIKPKYLWISVLIAFLVAIGLIVGVTYTSGALTNVFIVLIAITFIYMTIAINIASFKTFKYKPKPVNYQTIEYDFASQDIDNVLKKKGYKPRITSYGISYLKVEGTNAYKIVIIRNFTKYFNPEDNNQSPSSSEKTLAKCKKFIGFEIFFDYDEETLKKVIDFNLQGEKVYYSGLYVSEDKLICPNYQKPTEIFEELYKTILNDLNIEKEL